MHLSFAAIPRCLDLGERQRTMSTRFTSGIGIVVLFIGISSCSTQDAPGESVGNSGSGGSAGKAGSAGSAGDGGATGGTTGAGTGGSVSGRAGTAGSQGGHAPDSSDGEACDCSPLPGPCTPGEMRSPRTPSCPNLGGYRECSCDGTRWLSCTLGGLNPLCCKPGEVTQC